MFGKLWTIMCVSCKSMDKPAKQARMPGKVWIEILLSCPGDLLTRALSWSPSEKGGQG